MFERNYFKTNALCPKCGSSEPKPKYVPEDRTAYLTMIRLNEDDRHYSMRHSMVPLDIRPSTDLIVKDRVDCLCRCGFQWSAK